MKEIEIDISEGVKKVDTKPVLGIWKDQQYIRSHSLRASVKEILDAATALDVVKVGIIGEPSTGKTTLADSIGHLCHKMSEQSGLPQFAIRSFGKEEFLDMKGTLAKLAPTHYILKFRDLSFLQAHSNKKVIEQVKQAITEIRHLKEDVKIILIYDYHYTMGLDKYLRQANFRYFTSMGSSEQENMLKIVGNKYHRKVNDFTRIFVEMTTGKHQARFRIAPKRHFVYNYKNPFVPCLFYNNNRLRFVIFPTRQWIDPICSICSEGDEWKIESDVSIPDFIEQAKTQLGERAFMTALKLKLFTNGINVYSKSTARANKFLAKALEAKQISLEALAQHLNLKIENVRLSQKVVNDIIRESELKKE
jgi:hypothetical protein